MLKRLNVATIAAGFVMAAGPVFALETIVTQVDSNKDGTTTYHFAIKMEPGETMTPAASKTVGDFVTVYNFYGLVEGSVKTPPGWEFSSEEFGRTPIANGYPQVLPLDVPNTPNLTWTTMKSVEAGVPIEGFSATTRVAATVEGEYSAQVTRQRPTVQGAQPGTPAAMAAASKQASIGVLPTPAFLADVK